MPKMRPTYHIIGGGAAGLSAALYLAQRHPDYHITVYEAAGHPGGRAYSFVAADWQMSLDNATHVILGANTCCRRFAGKDFSVPTLLSGISTKTKPCGIGCIAAKKLPKRSLTPLLPTSAAGNG